MKTRTYLFVVLLAILVMTSCASEERLSPSELHSTFLVALNSGDIDSAMELFADNATFQTYEDEILVGKTKIKDYLESKIDEGIQVDSEVTSIFMGAEVKVIEDVTFTDSSLHCFAKYTIASGKISTYSWYYE